jgi:hypothetical protein
MRRHGKTPKDVRPAVVLWSKGILGPDDVLGSVLDCFDEESMAKDWDACEECDRDRVRKLLATYRPAEIPFRVSGPVEREWADPWQQERDRKYRVLLGLLGLEPSPEWEKAHRA